MPKFSKVNLQLFKLNSSYLEKTIFFQNKKNYFFNKAISSGDTASTLFFMVTTYLNSQCELRVWWIQSMFYLMVLNIWKLSRGEICVANFKAPLKMVRVWTGIYWPQSDRVTEWQSDRHPRVLSIRVGEIFCAWFQ